MLFQSRLKIIPVLVYVAILWNICLCSYMYDEPMEEKLLEKLLMNYNPFESPLPNEIVNISRICTPGGLLFHYIASTVLSERQELMHMSWNDRRLAWTADNFSISEMYYEDIPNYRIWYAKFWSVEIGRDLYQTDLEDMSFYSNGFVYSEIVVVTIFYCSMAPGNSLVGNKVCHGFTYHSKDFRILTQNNRKMGTCPEGRQLSDWKNDNLRKWVAMRIAKSNMTEEFLPLDEFWVRNITITLNFITSIDHFFVTPTILINIASIFQCLIPKDMGKCHFLNYLLIMTAFLNAKAVMELPVVQFGGRKRLITTCVFTVTNNLLYLIWLCGSVYVSRIGGSSFNLVRLCVEKSEKYRYFLLLPSRVHFNECTEKSGAVTWNYFSLLVDRLIFVIWIVMFVFYAI